MSNKIVVLKKNEATVAVEFNDSEPLYINVTVPGKVTCGSIYAGRVSNVKKDLNAVFVDFLPGLTGFLPFSELKKEVKQGDEFPVQVIKEPSRSKGYTLSTEISLSGKYCVVFEKDNGIKVSQKTDKVKSDRLYDIFNEKVSLKKHGVIIRTSVDTDNAGEALAEYDKLCDKLDNILKFGECKTLYSCVYRETPGYIRFIKDEIKNIDEIITEDEDLYKELSDEFEDTVRLHDPARISLSALYRLKRSFDLATDKKVDLPCGGWIYIEPTETLTAIDVNSGKIDNKKEHNEMVKKVNFEAALEISRQLKLRNISGMIFIDFINFDSEEDEKELLSYMKKLLKNDKCKTKVYGFTHLKLMEVSRQKINAPIYEYLPYL